MCLVIIEWCMCAFLLSFIYSELISEVICGYFLFY